MPPRKSKRGSTPSKVDTIRHEELLEVNLEGNSNDIADVSFCIKTSTEYFEFHDEDLKVETAVKEDEEHSSEPESILQPIRRNINRKNSIEQIFSRKLKLLIRKVRLMCEIKSAQFFVKYQMKNQELVAMTLSGLPPHILRIFNPVLVAEGKTLKNSVAMLATWWKNNIGCRMLPTSTKPFSMSRKSKILELKLAFFSKSAYEDDSVKLFALVCHGLGINIRFVHSLHMLPASVAQNITGSPSKFQYCPRFWIEIYSPFDERWIPVDCIQGFLDEKNRLENRVKPHSFVIAIDADGFINDLTEKYSLEYQEKSFKLRKDEDKWLKELIAKENSRKTDVKKALPDRDRVSAQEELKKVVEIPKTLSAIKNHPTLMLESQLRKYEVLYPVAKPVGYFKDESVFLRECVKKVRSKDAWLSQCARIVRSDEEPIKLVNLPRKAGAPEGQPTGVQPLYGEWQTDPYVPPEVINGKVPRNEHGNVDLFQPSMMPKGCVHVTLPGAWKVARHLKIDYADACIGFSFHGGRALPAIHGIVITDSNFTIFQAEYKNKLIESFKNDAAELEKQIAQKWIKIIKNALVARRLKQDSSISISESLISIGSKSKAENVEEDIPATVTISAFDSGTKNTSLESEIEEFDAI